VALNWRKYDPGFVSWVFEGKDAPRQSISEVDAIEFTIY